MGQYNIERDTLGTHIVSTAVGRFHNTGAAAGHYMYPWLARGTRVMLADDTRQTPGFVVITAQAGAIFDDVQMTLHTRIIGIFR